MPRGTTSDHRDRSTPRAGLLVTFPLSHFCEKARWALDHVGARYAERGYPPAVRPIGARPLGARPRDAATVPVLVGQETLRQSTDIVRYADRSAGAQHALYPHTADARRETDAVIARLDETLGPSTRAYFYAWALADPRRLRTWAACGLATPYRLLLDAALPTITARIAHHLGITNDSAAPARDVIDDEFAWISGVLADGRRYLGGDSFGAADLTFAALAGPILCPSGYGGERFALPPMPDELTPQIQAWRATAAGQHALRVYRDHRAPHVSNTKRPSIHPTGPGNTWDQRTGEHRRVERTRDGDLGERRAMIPCLGCGVNP